MAENAAQHSDTKQNDERRQVQCCSAESHRWNDSPKRTHDPLSCSNDQILDLIDHTARWRKPTQNDSGKDQDHKQLKGNTNHAHEM